MSATAKTIKENIARSKHYLARGDYLRCLMAIYTGLEQIMSSQVFGREKFEIGILMDEALRELSGNPVFQKIFPNGIRYEKGKERALYERIRALHDQLRERMETARVEKLRKQKLELDELLLHAEGLLAKGEPLDARMFFRKAAEQFGELEDGLLVDIAQRMIKAGLFQEALEYVEGAKEKNPNDPRVYSAQLRCLEALNETEQAEEIVRDALKRFGANESLYLRLAKLMVLKRDWGEAHNAAMGALNLNPLSVEAQKIADETGKRIFSG